MSKHFFFFMKCVALFKFFFLMVFRLLSFSLRIGVIHSFLISIFVSLSGQEKLLTRITNINQFNKKNTTDTNTFSVFAHPKTIITHETQKRHTIFEIFF